MSTVDLECADSLVWLERADPKSIDVVVTSPPYNLGIEYNSYDDSIPRSEYLAWTDRWLGRVKKVLADDGSLFLNMGGKPSDPTPPYQVINVALKHFVLQNTLFWIKSIAMDTGDGREVCRGHLKPINSPRFVNQAVEFIFHLTKTGEVPLDKLAIGVEFADESNLTRGTRGKNGNLRDRGDSWFLPYRTIKSRDDQRPHPASFPPELVERCYKLHGLSRIRRTLDPFSGIGSSAIAAVRLGLDHVGVEIDPLYHAEAIERVGIEIKNKGTLLLIGESNG